MDEFYEFMTEFHAWTGVDLRLYKRPQMERRLTTLRTKRGFQHFAAYLAALKQDPELLHEFLDRMTINVSEFFRNMERWDQLGRRLQSRPTGQTLKAWSAACSTGEEPYSLAILMEQVVRRPYDILATDIDDGVLHEARRGVYRAHQVNRLPHYAESYFHSDGGLWTVTPALRNHIRFVKHNLLADTYPSSLDLIICRNVLIYFTDEAKQFVIAGFAKALKPGGLLFVGSTEQFLRSEAVGLRLVAPFLYERESD